MKASAQFEKNIDKTAWEALLQGVPDGNEFLSPTWFQAWEKTFKDEKWSLSNRFLSLKNSTGLLAVLPVGKRLLLPFISFLAIPSYYMPQRAFPVKDCELANALGIILKFLESNLDATALRIGPVDTNNQFYNAIKNQLSTNQWSCIELPSGDLYNLELADNWDAYSKNIRGRAKKADYYLRKINKKGKVELKLYTKLSTDDIDKILDDLQTIESNSWVAKSGDPRFLGKSNKQFWQCVLVDDYLKTLFKIWIIYFDDEAAGFCLTLDSGTVRYQLINGYVSSLGKFSLGHIIFKQMIVDAIESGIKRINFGEGDSGHKSEWGAKPSSQLIDIIAFRPGLAGKILVFCYKIISKFKKN